MTPRIAKCDGVLDGSLCAEDVRVWLGDQELTGKDACLTGLSLEYRRGGMVTACLLIEPHDIEVDHGVLVALQALVDERERGVEDGGPGNPNRTEAYT